MIDFTKQPARICSICGQESTKYEVGASPGFGQPGAVFCTSCLDARYEDAVDSQFHVDPADRKDY